MAHVSKRSTKSGETRWEVRWRLPNGRELSKSFARRKDAEAFRTTVDADRLRGLVTDPRRARVTIAAYAAKWMDRRTDLRPTTRAKYTHLLAKHI